MELVDKERKEVWKDTKEKNSDKLKWNIHRNKDEISKVEGTFKGVLVGDKELEALEEESSKVKSDNKAVIYAGIEVNKNENDILTLPCNISKSRHGGI